jgi:2-polyprenyl-3-methyl-5-hydroxy-6-metoxy-1,4-benzoquinol methylase
MADIERDSWNQKYKQGSHSSLEPDEFFVRAWDEFVQPLFPSGGQALDVAGGVGRHSLWLAERGWKVTLVDITDAALTKAGKEAEWRGVKIETVAHDLESWKPVHESYDLLLVFFYLQREMFPALMAALRPGGLLIYKTYTEEQKRFAGGPSHPMHLLKQNELLQVFDGMRVLHYRETLRERGVAEFVGRKRGAEY